MNLNALRNFFFPGRLSPVKYNDHWVRLVLALISAQIIVGYGENVSYLGLLKHKVYYIALIGSFIIAYCLIHWVYWVTCWLDGWLSWNKHFKKRLLYQSVLGVVCTVFLAILMAAVYYSLNDTDIRDTRYFSFLLLIIALFITLLNAYYMGQYFSRMHIRKNIFERIRSRAKINWEDHQDLVAIFSEKKANFALTATGEKLPWPYTLADTYSTIKRYDFFRANKGCIINRSIIEDTRELESRVIELILSEPFRSSLYATVSQRKSNDFTIWQQQGSDVFAEYGHA